MRIIYAERTCEPVDGVATYDIWDTYYYGNLYGYPVRTVDATSDADALDQFKRWEEDGPRSGEEAV
jgi:hypothetical protein